MNRIVSVILIFAMLSVLIHLDELIKLPFLYTHYKEHKILHSRDSFSVFIYKHYVLNQKAESENDRKSDSQLPYKSPQYISYHLAPFILQNKNLIIGSYFENQNFSNSDEKDILFHFFDIWQPPKLTV